MRLRLFVVPVLALSILAFAVPLFAQATPDFVEDSLDLSVGAGGSSFDVDWGHGRMYGETVWIDWYSRRMPRWLQGLGLEIEARDISHNRHLPPQYNLRQDTAGGGVIYSWRHFRNVRPYAKYVVAFGSYDFSPVPVSPNQFYSHDTRTLWAPGFGLEVRAYRPIWVRLDYEYQTWQTLLGKTPNPQGVTVGVAYSFAYPFPRRR
jgi:hypothetical protein